IRAVRQTCIESRAARVLAGGAVDRAAGAQRRAALRGYAVREKFGGRTISRPGESRIIRIWERDRLVRFPSREGLAGWLRARGAAHVARVAEFDPGRNRGFWHLLNGLAPPMETGSMRHRLGGWPRSVG